MCERRRFMRLRPDLRYQIMKGKWTWWKPGKSCSVEIALLILVKFAGLGSLSTRTQFHSSKRSSLLLWVAMIIFFGVNSIADVANSQLSSTASFGAVDRFTSFFCLSKENLATRVLLPGLEPSYPLALKLNLGDLAAESPAKKPINRPSLFVGWSGRQNTMFTPAPN